MRKNYKFTLTELLAVIAIIVIVIALSITGYNMAMKSTQDTATKATIMKIELALADLHKKYSTYPSTATDNFFTIDLTSGNEKINDLADADAKNYVSKFLDLIGFDSLDKEETSSNVFVLLDGYGNKFKYFCPGRVNKKSFDLISAGADGSFSASVEAGTYQFSDFDDDNDDIANFILDK